MSISNEITRKNRFFGSPEKLGSCRLLLFVKKTPDLWDELGRRQAVIDHGPIMVLLPPPGGDFSL